LVEVTNLVSENPKTYSKSVHRFICNQTYCLSIHDNKSYASENAYNEIFEKSGEDIQNYRWLVPFKITKHFKEEGFRKRFTFEHMDSVSDFQEDLLNACKGNRLTVDFVKGLILKQRVCWITKEEDNLLTKNGFKNSKKPCPFAAYEKCGIKIMGGDNDKTK